MGYEPCSMGVGCDEYGVCYAEAHGAPDHCPRYCPPSPNPTLFTRYNIGKALSWIGWAAGLYAVLAFGLIGLDWIGAW